MGEGTGQASVPSPGAVTTAGSPGGDPRWPPPQPSFSSILGDSLVLGYETANLGPFREIYIWIYKPKRGGPAGAGVHVCTVEFRLRLVRTHFCPDTGSHRFPVASHHSGCSGTSPRVPDVKGQRRARRAETLINATRFLGKNRGNGEQGKRTHRDRERPRGFLARSVTPAICLPGPPGIWACAETNI